jgi:peptidoglycan/LPS O-acetylase OafA/YrhL
MGATMANRSLIASPGLFRMMLATAVVVNHMTVLQIGRGAVMLFFVLSGYWVSALWARTDGPHRVATFLLNRALRIWPLYLAVMLMCAVIAHHLPDLVEIFLFGIASASFPRLIGAEWSLDIEMQFYVLLPLLVMLRERLSRLMWIALMLGCAYVGWRLESGPGIVTVVKFLPAFAIGMELQRTQWKPSDRLAHGSLAAFAILSAAQMYVSQVHGPLVHRIFGDWDWDAIFAIWVIVLIPYLAASVHRPSDAEDRQLGDLSYPLYLVHRPVLVWMEAVHDWRTATSVFIALGIMVALTTIFWIAVDRPAERFRKQLLAARPFSGRYPDKAAT